MKKEKANIVNCSQFEELLTEYLDKTLNALVNKSVAEHALACPLCHALLNDVKESLELCRNIAAPSSSVTRLEARVISMTMPETAMACNEFEGHLSDYRRVFARQRLSSLGAPRRSLHGVRRHAGDGRPLDSGLLYVQDGRA